MLGSSGEYFIAFLISDSRFNKRVVIQVLRGPCKILACNYNRVACNHLPVQRKSEFLHFPKLISIIGVLQTNISFRSSSNVDYQLQLVSNYGQQVSVAVLFRVQLCFHLY